jgi:hypothetical protein
VVIEMTLYQSASPKVRSGCAGCAAGGPSKTKKQIALATTQKSRTRKTDASPKTFRSRMRWK